MTNPEQPTPREQAPMTAEHEPITIVLTEPGEPGHEHHPCIWLSTAATDDEPYPDGLWICLGHPTDLVHATIADITEHGDLPVQANVQDLVGFTPWTPMPGDTLDTFINVAAGVTQYGEAFAAWADMVTDTDMFDAFTDFYAGTFTSPESWAETTFSAEIEGYLTRTVRPDLLAFVTVDYSAIADYAVKAGRICLYPGTGKTVHAFQIAEEPRQ